MKTKVEFRVREQDAARLLGPRVGRTLPSGLTRLVVLSPAEPTYDLLGKAHLADRRAGRGGIISSWNVRRTYTQNELSNAEVIRLEITSEFEPAGEECGTTYDDSTACGHCGAGRIRTSPLALDVRRIQPDRDIDTQTLPIRADVARTIADEIVVSERLANILRRGAATGVRFDAIVDCRSGTPLADWVEPRFVASPVRAVEPTSFGIDPFDLDAAGEYRCPLGHVAGLNLLSEVTVDRGSWRGEDLVVTEQLTGRRAGLLGPAPLLLASPRTYRLLVESKVKGLRFEVAHLA